MIYLLSTDNPQELRIPRNLPSASDPTALSIRSTMREMAEDVEVEDLAPARSRYYIVKVEKAFTPGEYEYTLKAGNAPLAKGLIKVLPDDDTSIIEYAQNEIDIEYEQYGE